MRVHASCMKPIYSNINRKCLENLWEILKKGREKRKLFVTYNKAETIKQPNLVANNHLANKVQSCLAQPAPTSFNSSPAVDMIWCIVHITLHPGLRVLAEKKIHMGIRKENIVSIKHAGTPLCSTFKSVSYGLCSRLNHTVPTQE